MRRTINNMIAVEPLDKNVVPKTTTIGGLQGIEQKVTLMPLKVVFDYPELNLTAGMYVWINGGDIFKREFSRAVYKDGETQFILIPQVHVVMVGDSK